MRSHVRRQDETVYDVGAFHGLLTMHFAASAVQVICYEPNLRNRTRLEQNLELNSISNVCIRPVALSSTRGTADMLCDMSMPGYATIDSGMATEVGRGNNVEVEHIAVTTLDDDIVRNGLPPPDFIKIDVEGLELEVLRGARETLSAYRPDVFLEMHGETMTRKTEKITAIVNLLSSVGYAVLHVESGTRITPNNPLDAAEGHIYAVCAPSEPIATPRS